MAQRPAVMTACLQNVRPLGRSNAVMTEPRILVVHSRKGGVGKTTLAYEFAWMLQAPLIDLDWEGGGATRSWGYRAEDHERRPLIDALERGSTPRPMAGRRTKRPDLVPSHPDLELFQPDAETMAVALRSWAGEWGHQWVVVDTHPGATPATSGALQVANVVAVPVPLGVKDLHGTELTVKELVGYPLILVPNKIPPVPASPMLDMLARAIGDEDVKVAPPIPAAQAVTTRRRRTAMTSEDPVPKALVKVVIALERVARFIEEAAG